MISSLIFTIWKKLLIYKKEYANLSFQNLAMPKKFLITKDNFMQIGVPTKGTQVKNDILELFIFIKEIQIFLMPLI